MVGPGGLVSCVTTQALRPQGFAAVTFRNVEPTPGITQDPDQPVHVTVYPPNSTFQIGHCHLSDGRWYAFDQRGRTIDCFGDEADALATAVARVYARRERALEIKFEYLDRHVAAALAALAPTERAA